MKDFVLQLHMARWEFAATYNLGSSDCEPMTLAELLSFAGADERTAFEECRLGYTESAGDPHLREAVARTYEHLDAADVQVFSGSQEAIYIAMATLLGPQDHAIVVLPAYQSAETLPLSKCQVSGVLLNPENRWSLDLDQIADSMRSNTKLVSICFPNNPTGKIIPRHQLEDLITLCRSRGVWLFSDEVYRGLELDERTQLPQVADLYERGISVNSTSKTYGLAGLRLGWVASKDRDLHSRMIRYKHYLSGCSAALSEKLALVAINAQERVWNRNKAIIVRNLKVLKEFFGEFSQWLDWDPSDGGCVAFPRYKGPGTADAWLAQVLRDCGILLVPASAFESTLSIVPNDRFRIGFGRNALPLAVDVLRNHLRSGGKGAQA